MKTQAGISGSFRLENSQISLFSSDERRFPIFRSTDKSVQCIVFGELFLPSGDLLTQENFESQFLHAFVRHSNDLLANCEGAFVFALIDEKEKTVHLINDPFGNLALHYCLKNDTLYFSTHSAWIAESAGITENDERAILEYFGFGQAFSGKTFYRDIRRLGVASHLRFSVNGLQVDRYVAPSFTAKKKSDYPEILKQIKERLLFNVKIRTKGENIFSGLSGGFDSRVILAALSYLGRKNVKLFTIGLADSYDIQLARKLSMLTGFRHNIIFFDNAFLSRLPDDWDDIASLSEGGIGIEASPQLAVWQMIASNASRFLDGHGGQIYRRQILKAYIHQAKRYPTLAKFIFEKKQSPLLKSKILRREVQKESEKQVIRSLEEYFKTLPEHLTDGDKIDCLSIEESCANYYALAGNTEMNYTMLSHPLLSARIWELLSQLDDDFRATNGVNRYLIHELCPALEKIPLDNSGFKVPYRGYNYLRYLPQSIEKYIVNNISRISPSIGKKISLRHSPFTPSMVIAAGKERMREIALSSSGNSDQYFDKSAIEKLDVFDPALLSVANAKQLLGFIS